MRKARRAHERPPAKLRINPFRRVRMACAVVSGPQRRGSLRSLDEEVPPGDARRFVEYVFAGYRECGSGEGGRTPWGVMRPCVRIILERRSRQAFNMHHARRWEGCLVHAIETARRFSAVWGQCSERRTGGCSDSDSSKWRATETESAAPSQYVRDHLTSAANQRKDSPRGGTSRDASPPRLKANSPSLRFNDVQPLIPVPNGAIQAPRHPVLCRR
ncbi:hypothetical protein C8Q78DRAFT_844846 [Trametes maxima]|nr:hypothetical protein C8Q78DRAFT_844846 [Trametes maxima]